MAHSSDLRLVRQFCLLTLNLLRPLVYSCHTWFTDDSRGLMWNNWKHENCRCRLKPGTFHFSALLFMLRTSCWRKIITPWSPSYWVVVEESCGLVERHKRRGYLESVSSVNAPCRTGGINVYYFWHDALKSPMLFYWKRKQNFNKNLFLICLIFVISLGVKHTPFCLSYYTCLQTAKEMGLVYSFLHVRFVEFVHRFCTLGQIQLSLEQSRQPQQ